MDVEKLRHIKTLYIHMSDVTDGGLCQLRLLTGLESLVPPAGLPPGNREHFIVCDGFEGPSHEGLWIPEDFRNHANRLRYLVRDGERVRLMEFAWPEAMTWQDAVE